MSHSAKIVSAIFYEHTLASILAVSVIHATIQVTKRQHGVRNWIKYAISSLFL
jgi:hypothetical protein